MKTDKTDVMCLGKCDSIVPWVNELVDAFVAVNLQHLAHAAGVVMCAKMQSAMKINKVQISQFLWLVQIIFGIYLL